MRTYISKVVVFDAPRKDENCKSNINRMVVGAIVFSNSLGVNTPTNAVRLTEKEFNLLCSDLDIKGRDTSGNLTTKGHAAWSALKGLVNRHDGAIAEVDVEERTAGDTYVDALGEKKTYDKNSSSVRVSMIRLPQTATNRVYQLEESWSAPKIALPSLDSIFAGANGGNAPE